MSRSFVDLVESVRGEPAALDRLVEELVSGNLQRRMASAKVLARSGGAAVPVLAPLVASEAAWVRRLAVATLAEMLKRDPSPRELLTSALEDRDPWVRDRARRALEHAEQMADDVASLEEELARESWYAKHTVGVRLLAAF